jgi:ubiquinone/menaquinone biosynthesis C-methylase UbiE
MNHFDHNSAAQRYALARPYFQPQVIEIIRTHLCLAHKVPKALDVACGTGHSTQALLEIAEQVMGTDLSNAMLTQVNDLKDIYFQQAPAEQLPFANNEFDIVTVCMAYHWFDQPKFLAEAKRVLKDRGTLVVYNSHFPGIMEGNDTFQKASNEYYASFPPPKRSAKHPIDIEAQAAGFTGTSLPFSYKVMWNLNELTQYFCTQSSVIDQVEQGNQSIEQVIADLEERFAPYFSKERETFVFKGDVSLWRCRN